MVAHTNEDLGEELRRDKNVALVIKSYLWERIFVDDKDVICTSLEIVSRKNIFLELFLKICSTDERHKL